MADQHAEEEQAQLPRLASDIQRIALACIIGIVLAAIAAVLFALSGPPPVSATADTIILAAFAFSSASSIAYVILTFAVFQNVDAKTLARWLSATAVSGRRSRVAAEIAGTGPTIAAQWSVVAIVSVVALTLFPELLNNGYVIGLAGAVVASGWLVTVISYAVHYARLTATFGGLEFSGKKGTVFWDCVYLAFQVQTTFGASDVGVTTTLARRIVTGQTIVAFAFNTVIIALLISVIFLRHG
jgi:uncharacterized membrane protein